MNLQIYKDSRVMTLQEFDEKVSEVRKLVEQKNALSDKFASLGVLPPNFIHDHKVYGANMVSYFGYNPEMSLANIKDFMLHFERKEFTASFNAQSTVTVVDGWHDQDINGYLVKHVAYRIQAEYIDSEHWQQRGPNLSVIFMANVQGEPCNINVHILSDMIGKFRAFSPVAGPYAGEWAPSPLLLELSGTGRITAQTISEGKPYLVHTYDFVDPELKKLDILAEMQNVSQNP